MTYSEDPAFPYDDYSGLSAKQYAAIHLRVPNSETDWLDAMIRESLLTEIAAKVMAVLVTSPGSPLINGYPVISTTENYAKAAITYAKGLLAEIDKGSAK